MKFWKRQSGLGLSGTSRKQHGASLTVHGHSPAPPALPPPTSPFSSFIAVSSSKDVNGPGVILTPNFSIETTSRQQSGLPRACCPRHSQAVPAHQAPGPVRLPLLLPPVQQGCEQCGVHTSLSHLAVQTLPNVSSHVRRGRGW